MLIETMLHGNRMIVSMKFKTNVDCPLSLTIEVTTISVAADSRLRIRCFKYEKINSLNNSR